MGAAALATTDSPVKETVVWEPRSKPQLAFVTCPVFEIFFGGARGSLKTDGVLGEWLSHAQDHGEDAIGLMVRRNRIQLQETIERAKQIYQPLGFKFKESPDHVCISPNGARLRFAYLERDSDAEEYQGHSYTRVYVEEIGNFPSPSPIMKLMATLRSAKGVPCGFRATGNPGGAGQHWVKARYIDPAPLGWKIIKTEYKHPWTGEVLIRDRVFIPGKITDHNLLGGQYIANLQMAGSPQLVKAWLEGDWSVIAGAFFPEFSLESHVLPPFEIPAHWSRIRAGDWGSAKPFSIGWYGVSDGCIVGIPRGALVKYREWYGVKDGQHNVGLKLTAEEVAQGILEREKEKVDDAVLDPSAFSQDGGPSIAERMGRVGVLWREADNKRVARQGALGGWDQLRARLKGIGEGPMIYFTSNCEHTIRTLPAIQHDELKPEDVDTESEDHACFVAGTVIDGMGPVEKIGLLTRCDTDVLRLHFDDGGTITCTPDHQFLGVDGKWTAARNLKNIRLCSTQQLKNFSAFDIISAASIFSARAADFIVQFWLITTGVFQKVFTFITRTATEVITQSGILNCSRNSTIYLCMETPTPCLPITPESRPQNGMEAMMAGNGTPNIGVNTLRFYTSVISKRLARFAGRCSRLAISRFVERNIATKTVEQRLCVNVERLNEKVDVYCLATRNGWLSVGGVVASNCDETRYACMSRPIVHDAPNIPAPKFPIQRTIDQLVKARTRKRLDAET